MVDAVQTKLIVVDQQKLTGLEIKNLATKLAADTPARAGHQNHLTGQRAGQQGSVRGNRVTPQQILYIKLPKIPNGNPATRQIFKARQSSDMHGQRLQALDDAVAARP